MNMSARLGMLLSDKIKKNPKLSLILLIPGLIFLYIGNSKGEFLAPVMNKAPVIMTVTEVYNKNGRTILPDYTAKGIVQGESGIIEVSVFKRQYKELRKGDKIEVFKNPEGSPPYIFTNKLKSASPIFNVLGFRFSWHAIPGILFILLCPLFYFDAKRKRAKQEMEPHPGKDQGTND